MKTTLRLSFFSRLFALQREDASLEAGILLGQALPSGF